MLLVFVKSLDTRTTKVESSIEDDNESLLSRETHVAASVGSNGDIEVGYESHNCEVQWLWSLQDKLEQAARRRVVRISPLGSRLQGSSRGLKQPCRLYRHDPALHNHVRSKHEEKNQYNDRTDRDVKSYHNVPNESL
jgi:hypothetical protein